MESVYFINWQLNLQNRKKSNLIKLEALIEKLNKDKKQKINNIFSSWVVAEKSELLMDKLIINDQQHCLEFKKIK